MTSECDIGKLADSSLLESQYIYFNAAVLDQSIAVKTGDYVDIADARLVEIAAKSA